MQFLFSVVHHLLLCRWDVSDLGVQAAVVPPVDVLERGELDLLWRLPRPLAVDELALVEADGRLGHGVIVRVAGSTDRRGDPGLGEALRVADRGVLAAADALMYVKPQRPGRGRPHAPRSASGSARSRACRA